MRADNVRRVLLLGSGALKIGEGGEFDYSGSQAIKSLKEEGVSVVLVNPNIATVQTSESLADTVYFLPVTPEFVTRVLERERPDGILLGFGGQTALNCGIELHRSGVLQRLGVRVLGTPVESIIVTEDRELFAQRLRSLGVPTPRSEAVRSVPDALAAAGRIGYPVMVRAAFALGGLGSGVARSPKELAPLAGTALSTATQLLVEEYLDGWKEIEYEVVRDASDNCVTVCNMENMDPMGIHTGESIVVAPSQTLDNDEYFTLREVALKVVRSLGIVGECNIQFALSNGAYRVIEVNARLSRSSALASKATGYPLAHVAAKLSLGYALPEVRNKLTGVTQACFEPSLDYIVVKIPRWDLQKFERVSPRLGSEMKSVGEVMAIGRSFEEALQKAVRMLDIGAEGVICPELAEQDLEPRDRRLFSIADALERGIPVESISAQTGIDPWFLRGIERIVRFASRLRQSGLIADDVRDAKRLGFSDRQLALFKSLQEQDIRSFRRQEGILPVVKQVDTLAGEYPAQTNYLYLTYHGTEHDTSRGKGGVVVLGGGPYRIGSSVEFDWCCVSAAQEARKLGTRTIIINNNPETVSTDFDEADALYFEELTLERVRDICELESPRGVMVSVGGQVANSLALPLHRAGVPILGTSAENIDRAEDRHKFSLLCDSLRIDQPEWKELVSVDDAKRFAERAGYPVLVRPSYVLSGAAMKVAYHPEALEEYLAGASKVSREHPVVVSKFIHNAKELEFDGIAAAGEVLLSAVSEHIENAGVHSGDATIVLPPQRLYAETLRQVQRVSASIAKELDITGPFNIQFLAQDNNVRVIECNLRASRSLPFVSKVMKRNFISLATRAMLGFPVQRVEERSLGHVGVKAAQFSYGRLRGALPRLGVEMGSTGEVACLGEDMHEALLKSLLATGFALPSGAVLVSISGDEQRLRMLQEVRSLHELGFQLLGTENTVRFYGSHGIPIGQLRKIREGGSPNVLEALQSREVKMVIHLDLPHRPVHEDHYALRRAAADYAIPLVQNAQLARALIQALALKPELSVKAWHEYGKP